MSAGTEGDIFSSPYEYRSAKRNRVYKRKFDHDEARRLRVEGMSCEKIGERLGVSPQAVRRACDPEVRRRMDESARRNARKARVPCKAGCGRLIWPHAKARTGYCRFCWRAKQLRHTVRETELLCSTCKQWKPDSDFPTAHGSAYRRGHDPECRACSTIRRNDYRKRHPDREAAAITRQIRKRVERRIMARYIVFQPNGNGFVEVERVDAGSPAHAVEQVAKAEGEYVAVPEGRFQLMEVRTTQTLKVVK